MSSLNQQLKKGVLEILVLRIIKHQAVYGYELIKKLDANSDGLFKLKEGSLYPIMYRLEDKGFIESYRQEAEGKRSVPRKYYKITEEGLTALDEMVDAWHGFTKVVSSIIDKEEL